MFGKRRNPYAIRTVSVPALLLALGWIGLWLLWPAPYRARATAPARRLVKPQFVGQGIGEDRLYLNPTLFGRSSKVGFSVAERRDAMPGELAEERKADPMPLAWDPSMVGAPTGAVARLDFDASLSAPPAYAPVWPRRVAAESSTADRSGLHVTLRGALRRFGLRVPPFPASIAAYSAQSWSAAALLEMDDEGRATHVFLESGTGIPAVNEAVIQTLGRAVLERPGTGCVGRVEIGFAPAAPPEPAKPRT
jgi:hypothetical protein